MKKILSFVMLMAIILNITLPAQAEGEAVPTLWIHSGDVSSLSGIDGYCGGIADEIVTGENDLIFNISVRDIHNINSGQVLLQYDKDYMYPLSKNSQGGELEQAVNSSDSFVFRGSGANPQIQFSVKELSAEDGLIAVSWYIALPDSIDTAETGFEEIFALAFRVCEGVNIADGYAGVLCVSDNTQKALEMTGQADTYWLSGNDDSEYGIGTSRVSQKRQPVNIMYSFTDAYNDVVTPAPEPDENVINWLSVYSNTDGFSLSSKYNAGNRDYLFESAVSGSMIKLTFSQNSVNDDAYVGIITGNYERPALMQHSDSLYLKNGLPAQVQADSGEIGYFEMEQSPDVWYDFEYIFNGNTCSIRVKNSDDGEWTSVVNEIPVGEMGIMNGATDGGASLESGILGICLRSSEYKANSIKNIELFAEDTSEPTQSPEPEMCSLTLDSNNENVIVTGSGSYEKNSYVTVQTAVKKGSSLKFQGWYEGDVLKSNLETYTFQLECDTAYTARYEELEHYSVTPVYNGSEGTVEGKLTDYVIGETVSLTAVANEGFRFAGWGYTQSIIKGVDAKISFKITEDTVIYVNFEHGEYTVDFADPDGKVYDRQTVTGGNDAVLPEAPEKAGFNFIGWSGDYTNITADTVLYAQFENTARYSIDVVNGKLHTGLSSGLFDRFSSVCITADVPPAGKYFSGWENESGSIVSKSSAYRFSVYENMRLTAVYSDTLTDNIPYITICDTADSSVEGKLSYTAQVTMKKGYSLVECGVILLKNEYDENLSLGTQGIIKGKSSRQNKLGQFIISKTKVNTGDAYYGRAYLMYKDNAGNVFTVYSSNISVGER